MALNRGIGVSFTDKLRKVEQDLDLIRTEFLKELATEVVKSSPVDTGTYVMSHNIGSKSAAGQFTGNIRYIGPPGQNQQAMQNQALGEIIAQIDGLPKNQTVVSLSNNSAHANIVEHGGASWRRAGYAIYQTARGRAPAILNAVINRVRGI
jgi:hypothetical protein